MRNVFWTTIKKQLTPADYGLEFGILIKSKHMGHVVHSMWGLEFEFEDEIYNSIKMWISKNFKIITLSENQGQHFYEIVIWAFNF